MNFVYLTIDRKTAIDVYFADDIFDNREPALSAEEQSALLEKIAAQCCQALFTESNEHTYYQKHGNIELLINRVFQDPEKNPDEVLVQCSYALRSNVFSKLNIQKLDLNADLSFDYETDTLALPGFDYSDLLRTHSVQGVAEWLKIPEVQHQQKSQFAALDKATEKAQETDGVDILLAPDKKYEEIVKALCASLDLNEDERRSAAHLLPDMDLLKELLPLVRLERHQTRYLGWIEAKLGNIGKAKEDTPFENYILNQKGKLLDAIIDHKSAVICKFAAEHGKAYGERISDAQPAEYLRELRKFHYIRKNIFIALYNAAQDYYTEILPSLKTAQDAADLAAKLISFNKIFQGIAQINLNTLELTPLADALHNLQEYPRLRTANREVSFEQAVDQLLLRCANMDGTSGFTKASCAKAFSFVQERLYEFNHRLHPNPGHREQDKNAELGLLFNDIYAPLEDTTIGAGVRNLKIVARAIDSAATIAGHHTFFRLNDDAAKLDKDLIAAERHFRLKLADIKEYIDSLMTLAEKVMAQEDQALEEHYTHAKYNIFAFKDLSLQTETVRNDLTRRREDIQTQNDILKPYIDAEVTLNALAAKYAISAADAEAFKTHIFTLETRNKLEEKCQDLQTLSDQLPTTETLDQLIATAEQSDSLLTQGKKTYKHTADIREIQDKLTEHDRNYENIEDEIAARQKNVAHGVACIQCFQHCDNAIEAINAFRQEIAQRDFAALYLADQDQYALSPIAKAKDLHSKAERELARLEEQTTIAEQAFSAASPEDASVIGSIERLSIQASGATQGALARYKKDLHDILLCNMIVNAARNFPHWANVTALPDSAVTALDQIGLLANQQAYKIPAPVYTLATLANEDRFTDWETNPEQARLLLAEIKEYTRSATGSSETRAFQRRLNQMIELDLAHDLAALDENLAQLNQTDKRKPVNPPVTIKREGVRIIRREQTVSEKYPHLKKIMLGALIGIAVVAIVAAICAASAFTGGAPLIVAGTAAVMTIGGAGFAAGIIAATAVVASVVGGIIGFFASKAWSKRQAAKAQLHEGKAHSDLFHHGDGLDGESQRSVVSVNLGKRVTNEPFMTERVNIDRSPRSDESGYRPPTLSIDN